MKRPRKDEDFLARAMTGSLGEKVKEAIMAAPVTRTDMRVVVEAAVEFGGLSEEEIDKKYGPPPFMK